VTGPEAEDLYAILGVPRDADAETLRKAYRKLARKHHPDVNPGDQSAEDRFKRVSEAYSVLSDPEKRRNYDEFGSISLEGGFDPEAARRAREAFGARFGRGAGGGPRFDPELEFGDLDDLLGNLFRRRGWSGAGAMPLRGHDLEAELELDFLEAARGGERRLTIHRPRADGRVTPETVSVRIPPGVADGGRIRLPGRGGEGQQGGPPGDLFARIRVRPHAVFRAEGRDVHLSVPITLVEAIRGAKVEIPTLEGRATVTVPPESDSGRRLRLRGKGIPSPGGGPGGDLIVTLEIRVPRGLGAAELEKLEALPGADGRDLRKDLFS
jgi:DnaJ-class molecular chaperone